MVKEAILQTNDVSFINYLLDTLLFLGFPSKGNRIYTPFEEIQ